MNSPAKVQISSDTNLRRLDGAALATLFRDARTHAAWLDVPVSDQELHQIYELARMAPTSMNTSPLRIVFVRSEPAKARLLPAVAEGNREKVKLAPVTAILAYDRSFHQEMPRLFPHRDVGPVFAGMPDEKREHMAQTNATLQSAYVILAARALGLDAGPIGGFDAAAVDAAFFPDGRFRTILLVNLGHGDPSRLFPRNPRLAFEDACRIE
jgi:3-hydroxypropanoate dehydrogenase